MAAGIIGFVAAFLTLPEQGGHSLDREVQEWIGGLRSDGLTSVMELLSGIGSTVAIIVITLGAAGVFGYLFGWGYGGMFIGGVLGGFVINTILKNAIDRVRPEEAWGLSADGASFPSANAMLGFVIFGLMLIALWRETRWPGFAKGIIGVVAAALILFMGLCRVYFHVHYVSDILAGYSAGLAVLCATVIIADGIRRKKRG
ncbi:phosphatase PAP2 family protein [Paenibacillus soyae]|uniref:Phosphatase PAP2 family protein n=1 Tax=Paenibacillus soyae TaxID=2969249 RepID=A0A9X2MS17_9BACL|nr:phosphatase PAP2 family protein [Paenibacillus soyae]MCR2802932.1 phosphatase PAP2 family protein [Paenibacillus soyae]